MSIRKKCSTSQLLYLLLEKSRQAKKTIIDYDAGGNVVGIEILSASKKADINELIIQAFQKVMVENTRVAAA